MLFSVFICKNKKLKYANSVECWKGIHYLHIFFTIITMIIYLIGSYSFVYTFLETSYNKRSPTGKRTNKNDISGYWIKFLIVIIFSFIGEESQWPLLFSLILLSFWHWIYYLRELPDYNYELLRLKILKNSLFFWSSICLMSIKIINTFIKFNSGIIVFFLGWPLIIIIIYYKFASPLSMLLTEPSKITSSNDFIHRIRILMHKIEKFHKRDSQLILISYALKIESQCNLTHCPLKLFLEFRNEKNKAIVCLIEYIDTLYLMALSKFPKDVNLRINYVLFLISKMNNKIRAAEQLEICDKIHDKTLEDDFIIYRHKKQYEENCEFNFHDDNEEVGNYLLFKTKFKNFKSLISKVSILYVEFWNLLFKNHLENQQDFHTLNKYGSQINNLISEINTLFLKLRKMKKQDLELLELYYEFLSEIMSDKKQSSEIYKEIESIILNPHNTRIELDKEHFDINNLTSDDMHFYLIFSADPGKIGIINHVSNDICAFLGFSQNELLGHSINLLIPEILHFDHDKFISQKTNFNIEQKSNLKSYSTFEYKKRNVYAVTKSRYLIPFHFRASFIRTDSRENLWILKVLKFTSFFSPNEKNVNANIPYIVLTNELLVIQNFSGNCIKLFGNKFSNLINSCEVTSFIKEFHEEYLRFSVENENNSYEERLKIKRDIIKNNYNNPTQITWIRTIQNENEIEKRKELLLLTVNEILFGEKIKGYIFEFESMSVLHYSDSIESSPRNNKNNNNTGLKFIHNSMNKSYTINSNFEDSDNFYKKEKKLPTAINQKIPDLIDTDFIPSIPNKKGIEFLPKQISYKLNNLNLKEKFDYLKEKALKKLNENNSINDNSQNSDEDTSKLTDEYSSDYLSESNSNEDENSHIKKNVPKTFRSENNDTYYKISFTKMNFQIFNFQNNRFEDTPFEKKSRVQQILDKENITSKKEEKTTQEKPILQKPISFIDKEEDVKKENLFQQITDSLLKEEVPTCIIQLKIISFIIFVIIISYGLLFLLLIISLFNLLDKKYVNIKEIYEIQTGSVHGLKLVRELVLLSFPDYNNFYTNREVYRKNYTERLIQLYLKTNSFISDLSIKTAGLSENNFEIIFETILPTYFINYDYTVSMHNVNFISTLSKSITSLYAIAHLNEKYLIPLNLNVFFYMKNTLNGILIDIELAQETYKNEFNEIIKKKKKMFLIIYAISSIILLSTFYIIYNIFMDVQSTKNSYLEVFFEIKGNVILTYLSKCEYFTKKIQNFNENDLLLSEDSENSRLKKEKLRKNHINHSENLYKENEDNSTNQKNSSIIRIINIIFFSMQVLVVIYILIILLILFNFVKNLQDFITIYSYESKLQTNVILLDIVIREYLFDYKTIINAKYVRNIVQTIFVQHIIAKKNILSEISKYHHRFGKEYSDFRYYLFNSDICNITQPFFDEFYPNDDNFNCNTLLNGGAKYGLSVIMSNYYNELRVIKSRIINYEKVWEKYNLTYNFTLFGTENYTNSDSITINKTLYEEYSPMNIFNCKELKEIEIITEYLLIPSLVNLREKLDLTVQNYFEKIKIITYVMSIIIIVFFTLLYFLLWTKYVESLNDIIYQTKKMLAIIPKDILSSLNSVNKLLNIKSDNRRRNNENYK